MRRRKTLSKYHVDDNGQIINTQPTLSSKTRKLMEFMTMINVMSEAMTQSASVEDDNESTNDEDIETNEGD